MFRITEDPSSGRFVQYTHTGVSPSYISIMSVYFLSFSCCFGLFVCF